VNLLFTFNNKLQGGKNLLVTCLPTRTHAHAHIHKLFSWHSTQVLCVPKNVANLSYLQCLVSHQTLLMVKLKNIQVWPEVLCNDALSLNSNSNGFDLTLTHLAAIA